MTPMRTEEPQTETQTNTETQLRGYRLFLPPNTLTQH